MRWPCPETLVPYRVAGKCELCPTWCPAKAPHHLFARGRGDATRLDIDINLIGLGAGMTCGCHDYLHSDARHSVETKRHRCLAIILQREGLEGWYTTDDIWDVILRLVALPPHTTEDELAEMGLLRWFKPSSVC